MNATAGRLTVLRAFAPSQLEAYRRAITGIPGPERILVTIDGNDFNPEDHILIGFGESYRSISGTVRDFFFDTDINPNTLPAILLSYGLDSVADTPIASLTESEARQCRLLAAVHQTKKLVLLHNPFEVLNSDWRERFAELLLTYVTNKEVPLLITSMTYRPECFINNELIQRVQVGETDQRTIGFGQAPSEYKDLIEELRSTVKKPKANSDEQGVFPPIQKQNVSTAKTSAKETIETEQKRKNFGDITLKRYGIAKLFQNREFRQKMLVGTGSLFILILIARGLTQGRPTAPEEASKKAPSTTTQVAKKETVAKDLESVEARVFSDKLATIKNTIPKQFAEKSSRQTIQKTTLPKVKKHSRYMIDAYETSIRDSIMASFEGREAARAAHMQFASLNSSDAPKEISKVDSQDAFTRALLKDLKKTDGSGEDLPDRPDSPNTSYSQSQSSQSYQSAPPPNYQDMSQEERRALLREKFRMAIERAAQNR